MQSDPPQDSALSECFDVDGMLGGLAKWLRILGHDAAFPRTTPSAGRWFVTMNKRNRDPAVIIVTSVAPLDQLQELLDQTGIAFDPALVFIRCIICNVTVNEIPKETVVGRVPEKIFATKEAFRNCPDCGRIYWDGSHGRAVNARIAGLRTRIAFSRRY